MGYLVDASPNSGDSDSHPRVSWDAHAHVIGDERAFPFAPGRGYTPPPAPLGDYLGVLDTLGLDRGVLVQPSVYGHDHRCLCDALDRAGGRLRGIAVPAPGATSRDLDTLHQYGIRGVRCNLINPGGLPLDAVAGWRDALRALGWHVQLHVPLDDVAACIEFLSPLKVPVVVDHMGRPAEGVIDPATPGLTALIALVREGRCFVKLSAPYRLSSQAAPWSDVTPLARGLAAANPGACLWGSDWPHTDTAGPVLTGDLLAALRVWCPEPAARAVVTSAAASALFASA